LRRLIALGILVVSTFGINSVAADTNNTVTTTTETTTTIAIPVVNVGLVPRSIVLKWEKVAVCETGFNWTLRGSLYSGGLGITNINWITYGGRQFANNAADASPEEQIYIATKINSSGYIPDQSGCGYGW
jgi:hypothetical protein